MLKIRRWTKSKVISPKKIFIILALLAGWSFLSQPVFATSSQYYDFGPYYQNSGVLGFSFSSLENLPAPTSSPTSSSEPAPTPSSTSAPAPAPTSEPAPAPTSQPAPAPSP